MATIFSAGHLKSTKLPQAADPEVAVCAGCNSILTRRGPHGECLRCAIRLVMDGEAGDGSAAPAENARDATPFKRYGHFEVLRGPDGLPAELGSGAMATTYRAMDTVLCLPVALKVIGPSPAHDPGARARFLREARAAARLRHPNVAAVTHYGEQAGECFYAMELIEGETLTERVRRTGALTPAQTLEVGVQVARALAAAEAFGVVHRDIKPSNLMLVGPAPQKGTDEGGVEIGANELHVKVIDWGLAKAVSADDALLGVDHTCPDGFVGTPAFASPEQFSCKRGRRIDTRSDIYSLGVTLWYLLCGRMPFVGDSLDAIHAHQKRLPLTQLAAARVPGCLSDVLRRMLAFQPTNRPQSARELLDVLRQCQEGCADGSSPVFEVPRTYPSLAVGRWVFLLLLMTGSAWLAWRHLQAPPGEKPTVAVLPFENPGPNPADAFFTAGVQEKINDDLTRLAALEVIGADHTQSIAPGQRNLSKISQELGARYLLDGQVRRTDKRVEISVRLTDARDPLHPWSWHQTSRANGVFTMQSEATRAVAKQLRVRLTKAEEGTIDQPPTSDLAAYDLYLRAHGGFNGPFASAAQEYRYLTETGLPLLEQAVARDPRFVLAYCDLANGFDRLAFYESGRAQGEAVAKHRGQAEAALASARRLCPDAGEVRLAQADHYFSYHVNLDEALQDLSEARRRLPNGAAVERLGGEINRFVGRWEDAVRCFKRAARLEPRNPIYHHDLSNTYAMLRRYEDAALERNQVAALSANLVFPTETYLAIIRLEGWAEMAPLRAVIDRVAPANNVPPESLVTVKVLTALYSHDAAQATALLGDIPASGLTWRLHRLPKAWFEALAARMRHDDAGAREAFERARSELEKVCLANAENGWYLSYLAVADAGLGRREEAVREASHACELNPVERFADRAPIAACNLAVVYAWTGQPERACQTLQPWLDRPAGVSMVRQPSYGDLRLNPVWDPLRGRPDFEALVERLAPKPTVLTQPPKRP